MFLLRPAPSDDPPPPSVRDALLALKQRGPRVGTAHLTKDVHVMVTPSCVLDAAGVGKVTFSLEAASADMGRALPVRVAVSAAVVGERSASEGSATVSLADATGAPISAGPVPLMLMQSSPTLQLVECLDHEAVYEYKAYRDVSADIFACATVRATDVLVPRDSEAAAAMHSALAPFTCAGNGPPTLAEDGAFMRRHADPVGGADLVFEREVFDAVAKYVLAARARVAARTIDARALTVSFGRVGVFANYATEATAAAAVCLDMDFCVYSRETATIAPVIPLA